MITYGVTSDNKIVKLTAPWFQRYHTDLGTNLRKKCRPYNDLLFTVTWTLCFHMFGTVLHYMIYVLWRMLCCHTFITLKTKSRQFDIFVVTGGTISCHNDNLQRNQRQQNCQIDNPLFPMLLFIFTNELHVFKNNLVVCFHSTQCRFIDVLATATNFTLPIYAFIYMYHFCYISDAK